MSQGLKNYADIMKQRDQPAFNIKLIITQHSAESSGECLSCRGEGAIGCLPAVDMTALNDGVKPDILIRIGA